MQKDLRIQSVPIADLVPAPYNPRQSPRRPWLACAGGRALRPGRTRRLEPPHGPRRRRPPAPEGAAGAGRDRDPGRRRGPGRDRGEGAQRRPEQPGDRRRVHGRPPRLLAEIEAAMPELAELLRFDDLADQTKQLLADLTPDDGLTDPDDVPEAPETPITQPGDLWVLGGHRLVCGDSGDPAVLARLMDGPTAALYATDPPYGVGYDGTSHPQNQRDKAGRPRARQPEPRLVGDTRPTWDHYEDHRPSSRRFLDRRLPDSAAARRPRTPPGTAGTRRRPPSSFRRAWEAVGHPLPPDHHVGEADLRPRLRDVELPQRALPDGLAAGPQARGAARSRTSIPTCWEVDWEGARPAARTACIRPRSRSACSNCPMLKHTRPGDICLETFAGSGSQIIAAERLGRRCFAVERKPRFCDVIVLRWEQFTGQTAVRIAGEVVVSGRQGLPGRDPAQGEGHVDRRPPHRRQIADRLGIARPGDDRRLAQGRRVGAGARHHPAGDRGAGQPRRSARRSAEMNTRHLKECQLLQTKGVQALRRLDPTKASEAAAMIDAGIARRAPGQGRADRSP